MWIPVREPGGRIAFLYNPTTSQIKIQRRKVSTTFNLTEEARRAGLAVPDQLAPVGRDDVVAEGRGDHAPVPVVCSQDVVIPAKHP